MTQHDKKGTGEELGRVSVGDIGSIIVEDDGDDDLFIEVRIEDPYGNRGLNGILRELRRQNGDDWITAQLESATANTSMDDSDMQFEPDVFSCAECNRTFPGSNNANPGSGRDVCTECHDDD